MSLAKFGVGSNPWDGEPAGPVRWEHLGFVCEALRPGSTGGGGVGWVWCGYVLLPAGMELCSSDLQCGEGPDLSVHGGITYQGLEVDGVQRIGFDCGHSGDARAESDPQFASLSMGGGFRNLAYVRAEIESLAKQCLELGILQFGDRIFSEMQAEARELIELSDDVDSVSRNAT